MSPAGCLPKPFSASLGNALRQIAALQPDLVITDMSLRESKGLDTVAAVVQAQAPRPVLVVSMYDELIYAEQALALGWIPLLYAVVAGLLITAFALNVF